MHRERHIKKEYECYREKRGSKRKRKVENETIYRCVCVCVRACLCVLGGSTMFSGVIAVIEGCSPLVLNEEKNWRG